MSAAVPIHVATTCNDRYFPGLCVTLLSAIISSRSGRPFAFHVFDTGLSARNKQSLKERISDLDPDSSIEFIWVDADRFNGLNPDYGGGVSTYARLLMGSLLACHKCIYIDSDFLVLSDLSRIFDEEMDGAIVRAVPEIHHGRNEQLSLSYDCPFVPAEETARHGYWNCGFLLVDLDAWRAAGVEASAMDVIASHGGPFKAWDQTILNYVLRGRIGALDRSLCWASSIGRVPVPGNIHFISARKPWNSYATDTTYRLWYLFHEMFVGPPAPLDVSIQSRIAGILRGLRDAILTRNEFLETAYLGYLSQVRSQMVADCLREYLKQCRARMSDDPGWKSRDILKRFEDEWRRNDRVINHRR